jgi:hypothetical protein
MTQTNTTQNKEELDKSLWIKIPDWIYIGSKEIEIKYQRPDGEWCISTFSPLEKYELNKELLSQAHQSGIEEGIRKFADWVWSGWNLDLRTKDRAIKHFLSLKENK